ncbi:MAG: hypothetical protein H0W70_09235 [Actinobacteria bacterium]|nr:hypothetical protein [Actinomycetota bacterium]
MLRKASGRRLVATLMSGGLVAGAVAIGAGPAHGVAVPVPPGLSASAQGSTLHVHALQTGLTGPKVADTDVAFSSTSVNSGGLNTAVTTETGQTVSPPRAGKNAYGRGSGIALGIGSDVPVDKRDLILGDLAEAAAQPPDPNGPDPSPGSNPKAAGPYQTGIVDKNLVDVKGDPVAYAGTLRGQAQALWNPKYAMPMLGTPLGFGLGYAADVRLANVGTADPTTGTFPGLISVASNAAGPQRAGSQAFSLTYLVNNGDGTCGIANEIHETYAPVALNLPPDADPTNDLVIEVLGEWVLKTVVTGKPGGSSITYAPGGSATPTTPLLRIIQGTATNVLTTQDLFDKTGLNIPASPLADITVGEAPRAIQSPAGTTPDPNSKPIKTDTQIATAVDVVRVIGVTPAAGVQAAELRVGHFESRINVPAGGVNCEIPISKTALPATVGQPVTFTVNIPVDKDALIPFPCDLTNIKLTDTVSVFKADTPSKPPRINLTGGTAPNGSKGVVSADKQSITFDNIGNYHPGDPPLVVTITGVIPDNSGTGTLKDDAVATASAGNCKAVAGSVIEQLNGANGTFAGSFFGKDGAGLTANINGGGAVKVLGSTLLIGPQVGAASVLAVTGRNDGLFLGLAFAALLSAAGITRLRRRVRA